MLSFVSLVSNNMHWAPFACHSDIWTTHRHLKDLLRDTARSDYLFKEHNQILADFSRQRMTKDTVHKLLKLAEKAQLKEKIEAMYSGEHINVTEDRPVLHVALRAPREQARSHLQQLGLTYSESLLSDWPCIIKPDWWFCSSWQDNGRSSSRRNDRRLSRHFCDVQKITVDGQDAVKDVWEVLDKIKAFTDKVRDGEWKGVTGKPLVNVVAIGIGGSFLGPLFVHTALRSVSLRFSEFLKTSAPIRLGRII